MKYNVYCGDHLLCVTENYTKACRHAKNGKKVVVASNRLDKDASSVVRCSLDGKGGD